jgi:hypothetical protein
MINWLIRDFNQKPRTVIVTAIWNCTCLGLGLGLVQLLIR